ncbi:hypothetical protein TEA_026685 [Camellia sinensis var. sinensis]|uniref:Uncharacterized protein n=1 Tax=Camellia sinensis var. sinensis TaxID=542762 RepID=A0A4S4E3Z4_CAMSN|nr:hypothetical protein TEA_026685 [Camellia sinensis var. sinensis]
MEMVAHKVAEVAGRGRGGSQGILVVSVLCDGFCDFNRSVMLWNFSAMGETNSFWGIVEDYVHISIHVVWFKFKYSAKVDILDSDRLKHQDSLVNTYIFAYRTSAMPGWSWLAVSSDVVPIEVVVGVLAVSSRGGDECGRDCGLADMISLQGFVVCDIHGDVAGLTWGCGYSKLLGGEAVGPSPPISSIIVAVLVLVVGEVAMVVEFQLACWPWWFGIRPDPYLKYYYGAFPYLPFKERLLLKWTGRKNLLQKRLLKYKNVGMWLAVVLVAYKLGGYEKKKEN